MKKTFQLNNDRRKKKIGFMAPGGKSVLNARKIRGRRKV